MAWDTKANVRGPAGYNATGAAEDDAAIAAFIKSAVGTTATSKAVDEKTAALATDPASKTGLAFAAAIGASAKGKLDANAAVAKASVSALAKRPSVLLTSAPAMKFNATEGTTISAPAAAFETSNDLDIRVLVAMDSWTPTPAAGTTMTLVSRAENAGASQYQFEIGLGGFLLFRWSTTGAPASIAKASLPALAGMPAGAPLWVRVVHDKDNGTGSSEVYFYTSSDGTKWDQIGPSIFNTGAASYVPSTDPLRLGGRSTAGVAPLAGKIFEALVMNGIDGEPLGHFKAAPMPCTDAQGNTWSATGLGVSLVQAPASSLSVLPTKFNNEYAYNGSIYAQPLTEWGGFQFAAFWGTDRYLRIAKRTIGSNAWTVVSMEGKTEAGLLNVQVKPDGHNTVSIHADADGYLHVAGNHHGDWLRYIRSTAPGDITGWVFPGMIRGTGNKIGTDEGLVTYPRFFTNPATKEMFFLYRNGASGSGNTFLNRYVTSTKSWVRVAQIFNGLATAESAYEDTPVFDESGVFHLSYSWVPDGGGFNDRTDVCYMRSTDGGVTWKDISGKAIPTPVTHTTAPVIIKAGSNSGLINQCGLAVDSQGNPHLAHFWAPDGNRNIWHTYWTGTAWASERVTDLGETGITWTGLSRPTIIHYAGRLLVLWRHQDEGWIGKLWATDVSIPGQKQHHILADINLGTWESAPDFRAIRRGSLNLVLTRVAGATVPAGFKEPDWSNQPAGVLTVDLSRFDQRAVHRVPKNKPTDP